jgi:hypothetical protein
MIVCIIVEQWKCFDTGDARYKHEDYLWIVVECIIKEVKLMVSAFYLITLYQTESFITFCGIFREDFTFCWPGTKNLERMSIVKSFWFWITNLRRLARMRIILMQ